MRRAVLAVVFLCLALPAAASGALPELPKAFNLPWERVLPALPGRTDIQPHAIPGCRDGSLVCVERVERRLRTQTRRLDRACDHRVIASLAYLRITQALRRDLRRRHPRFFRHRRWMAYVITDFSNSYFRAFRNYRRGGPVPEAWRLFYDQARSGDANSYQDLLAFSNAHAQHDLPFTYASMGLRTRSGASRKVDHDGVNEINVRVIPKLLAEVHRRYDPSVPDIPGPLDEMAGLEPTKSWREMAWRGAERLVGAPGAAARGRVAAQIRAYSAVWARAITGSPRVPGTRAARDAHCRAYHAAARRRG